jgi:hypothetical protein
LHARTRPPARTEEACPRPAAASLIPDVVAEAAAGGLIASAAKETIADLPPRLRKPRLRRSEAAEYLGLVHGIEVAPATLAKLVTTGGGPAFNKFGQTPLYPREELDRWATERLGPLVRSSSEARG